MDANAYRKMVVHMGPFSPMKLAASVKMTLLKCHKALYLRSQKRNDLPDKLIATVGKNVHEL